MDKTAKLDLIRKTGVVAIMRATSSEQLIAAADAIKAGGVRVISLENQQDLLNQIRRQYSEGFDQTQIAHWGKQIGARYFVTGKVYTTDERVGAQRRVQYYMFMQVIDVETGEILFQNKSAVTKAIVRD